MNRRKASGLLAGVVIALGALGSSPALAERPYVAIEQRLSAEQMRATGLDQLSPEQLSLLNQLLRDEHTQVAVESVAAERVRKKSEDTAVVSSRLNGEFRGWKTGAVFELENGQRWRAMDGEFYTTKRLPNPNVTVKPSAFGTWYMQVEGANVNIKVKRIEP